MALVVEHVFPLAGTEHVALWDEGHATHLSENSVASVPGVGPNVHAWIALVDGAPAGIQAAVLDLRNRRAHSLLSYVRPEFRRQGIYRAMQDVYDLAFAQAGCDEVWSSVVANEDMAAVRAALEARGAVVAQVVYRRPVKVG